MAILMYDAENVEIKFSRLGRHLKLFVVEQFLSGKKSGNYNGRE